MLRLHAPRPNFLFLTRWRLNTFHVPKLKNLAITVFDPALA